MSRNLLPPLLVSPHTPLCCLSSASSNKSFRLSISLLFSQLAKSFWKLDDESKKNTRDHHIILMADRTKITNAERWSQRSYMVLFHLLLILPQFYKQIFQFKRDLLLINIMLQFPLLNHAPIKSKWPFREKTLAQEIKQSQ